MTGLSTTRRVADRAQHARARHRWTRDEELRLVAEVTARIPVDDIARAHRRTVNAIQLRSQRLGLGKGNGASTARSLPW